MVGAGKVIRVGGFNLSTLSSSILGVQQGGLDKLMKPLFSNGEQGFAYDPNDLSTMWQDQAKLLPVTGEGQPVWHILDKSGNNNHAFATSSATRPILQRNATTGAYYLAFDGTDDFLVTNNIDFTSTDKVSLFAGVRKLSDAATGMVLELSSNINNLSGAFNVSAPFNIGIAGYGLRSSGAGTGGAIQYIGESAPHAGVLTGFGNISGDSTVLRINGTQRATITTDQGTGNYGNYPLYIGRRGGTILPFNGHLYSLIGIGRLTSDSETIALEKAIAKNTGVTLNG